MSTSACLTLVFVAFARLASAQSLPQWTAELTAGAGTHTTRAGPEWYFGGSEGLLRIGLAYRIAGGGARAAYVKLDYATDGDFGDKLSCTVTPTGGCYHNFHSGHGGSVALGVRQRVLGPLVVGAAAGIGQYGNAAGGDGAQPYVDGDITLHVLPHVAVIGVGRYLRWSAGGRTYWFAPLMAGLQIH